jgi:CRISPR-associated protein Cmr1
MNQLTFRCEVLTPLFLDGAETRVHPELPAPSLRGAMRYWYRAILGGSTLISSDNPEELLKILKGHEAELFGDTERCSAIATLVRADKPAEIDTFEKDRAVRTPDGSFLPTGKDYLLWSMAASGRPGTSKYEPAREYIKPGSTFTVELRSRVPQKKDALEKAAAALWLVANLGSLGSRANRGAGSIEAREENPVGDLSFRHCSTVDKLQEYLADGVRRCLSLISGSTTWRALADVPNYDVLAPGAAEIWVVSTPSNGWETAMKALEGIGSKLRDYRSHRSPLGRADHDAVLDWLEGGGKTPQIKRAVFGLPIPFRYSGGGPGDVIIPVQGERRASPLRIRITRLATGRYVGVLTLFKSRFLGEGVSLRLQTRKWSAPPPTDYTVIQDFIETFEIKREVTL